MKTVVVVLTGIMVLGAVAVGGCKAKPAEPKTTTVSGTVTSINTPSQPGPDQVVVQTPQGQQTFTLSPDTDINYNNTACPIEDAGKLITPGGNVTYNCTITYDETYHAIAAGFWKQVP